VKRAVILHGTSATPADNWFPWLKQQLEARGYEVWVPQLPGAEAPNAQRYTEFLLSSDWDFQDSLVIGHSAGAVEILHLLQHLPDDVIVKTAVCVSAFSQVLADEPDWEQLKGLFAEPLEYPAIAKKAGTLLFVHAADDPWCDPEQAKRLAQQTESEYVELPSGQHFSLSLDPTYTEFPQLVEILEGRHLL
jgi:predicted alpha/beta hydrolase family esterase